MDVLSGLLSGLLLLLGIGIGITLTILAIKWVPRLISSVKPDATGPERRPKGGVILDTAQRQAYIEDIHGQDE
jgi:hypothetical protein